MTKYKKGDKVVVGIDEADASELNNERDMEPDYEQVLGKLEDFQPAEEKIRFTVEEKKEFDKLKYGWTGIYKVLDSIVISRYPKLYAKLFTKSLSYKEQNKVLIEFVKAWTKPELIEVVSEPEKHEIKVGIQNLYFNDDMGTFMLLIANHVLEDHFTLDEVKEAEKKLGIQGLQDKWHEAAKGE